MSLRKKLLITLVPVIIILFCFIVFTTFDMSRNLILKQIRNEAEAVSMYYACEFSSLLGSAQKVAEGMANIYEIMPKFTDKSIQDIIRENLQKNPEIYGSTLSLVPSETPLGLYAPYYCRDGGAQLRFESLATPSYDYVNQSWFTEPIAQGKGVWSEPYYDKGGGNILMVTYSVPVVRAGRVKGIATVDVSLESLVKKLRTLQLGATGYGFIVSKKGYIVAHPDKKMISSEPIFDIVKTSDNPVLKRLSDIFRGDKVAILENVVDPYTGKVSCMVVSPIGKTGWELAIAEESKTIFAPMAKLRSVIIVVSVIVIALLILLILIITAGAFSPVSALVKQTERFAQGHFDARLDDKKGTLEIQKLSRAFNAMGGAIEDYIQKLTEEQKKREIFLAAISHELMTPMTMIRGYVDLLKDEVTETQCAGAAEYIDVIGSQSAHLNMVIYDLFVVNGITDFERDLNYGKYNIEEIVKETAAQAQKEGVAHKINVSVAAGAEDLTANVDRDKLAHCFKHILDNSIKFSPGGGGIEISVGTVESGNRKMIEVVFQDHGIGIPQAELDKIFDKFYQVDMSSTRKFEGMGNGLFICKKIIDAHKGEIFCESVAGAGSKFYVLIPTG